MTLIADVRREDGSAIQTAGLVAAMALGLGGVVALKSGSAPLGAWIGVLDEALVGAVWCALVMACYLALSAASGALRREPETVGDNAYYLGFLFTLASLGVSLWSIDQAGSDLVGGVVAGFGVALSSTVLGVAARMTLVRLAQTSRFGADRTVEAVQADFAAEIRKTTASYAAAGDALQREVERLAKAIGAARERLAAVEEDAALISGKVAVRAVEAAAAAARSALATEGARLSAILNEAHGCLRGDLLAMSEKSVGSHKEILDGLVARHASLAETVLNGARAVDAACVGWAERVSVSTGRLAGAADKASAEIARSVEVLAETGPCLVDASGRAAHGLERAAASLKAAADTGASEAFEAAAAQLGSGAQEMVAALSAATRAVTEMAAMERGAGDLASASARMRSDLDNAASDWRAASRAATEVAESAVALKALGVGLRDDFGEDGALASGLSRSGEAAAGAVVAAATRLEEVVGRLEAVAAAAAAKSARKSRWRIFG